MRPWSAFAVDQEDAPADGAGQEDEEASGVQHIEEGMPPPEACPPPDIPVSLPEVLEQRRSECFEWTRQHLDTSLSAADRLARACAMADFKIEERAVNVSRRGDMHLIEVSGMKLATYKSTRRNSTTFVGVHTTSPQGAIGIMHSGQLAGSETLDHRGLWCQALPHTAATDVEFVWELADSARKQPRNTSKVMFIFESFIDWVPLNSGGHSDEAEIVARHQACHHRQGRRWAFPHDATTVVQIVVEDAVMERADALLRW